MPAWNADHELEMRSPLKNGPVKEEGYFKDPGDLQGVSENILICLKENDLIRTTRGANGGFELGKTSLRQSIFANCATSLEGTMVAPVECPG